jgi:hypothetical protein
MFIKRGDGKIISVINDKDLDADSKKVAENIASNKEITSKENKKESDKKLEN